MVSFGLEEFAERYGTLKPSQFVDVISLVGDKSDNIPGCIDHIELGILSVYNLLLVNSLGHIKHHFIS